MRSKTLLDSLIRKSWFIRAKMVLVIIAALLFCEFGESVFAQDVLILKSGTEIKVTIIEEGPEIIKYRDFENPTGPLYSIAKDKVSSVIYKKGSKENSNIKEGEAEKTRIENPAKVPNSPALTAIKRNVYLDGKIQSSRSVRLLMEDQPEALRNYESGKKLCGFSNTCALGVMITSFVFSKKVNQKETSEEKIRAGIPGLVIDGGFIVAAIIMSASGKSKIRSSVNMYNSAVNNPVSYKLEFGLQENGIGLALKF